MNEFIEVLSNKEENVTPIKSTAYVSLCVSPSAVDLPALYSFLQRQWNKRNYSTPISEMFFTFITRKTIWEKLFPLNVCEATLQAARAYKRRELWRETHKSLWLLIRRTTFLTPE